MASTYVAGVFLTVSTYNGPQFVYHYYDESVVADLRAEEDSEEDSDGSIEWSDDSNSSADDDEQALSPVAAAPAPRAPLASSHKSDPQLGSAQGPSVLARGRGDHHSLPQLSTFGSQGAVSNASPRTTAEGARRSDDAAANGESVAESKSSSHGSAANVPTGRPQRNGSQSSKPAHDAEKSTIFGFERGFFAEMLSPPQSMCNERFSLAIDDCVITGVPIHILESGTWRQLKKKTAAEEESLRTADSDGLHARRPSNASSSSAFAVPVDQSGPLDNPSVEDVSSNAPKSDTPAGEFGEGGQTGEPLEASAASLDTTSRSAPSDAQSQSASTSATPIIATTDTMPDAGHRGDGIVTEKDSPMRMFHVAFALIPPITEATLCEERVYRYILLPLVRMLRNEQASRNYVWEQVVKIQRARDETSELSLFAQQQAIEEASELALALKNLFKAMTNMDIARIMVSNKARAFQVPLQLELAQLPSLFEKVSPHAYLSTSNLPSKEIKHDSHEAYGLLLLDDPEVIVQEIEVDASGPVATMIRSIDPTSSIAQLAQQNKIDINQIVSLVWSLVYWRRARIIIPLNYRHTYGVSPLAPLGSEFNRRAKKFRELFPMMPPLQRLLSTLSTGKPKPYMMHVPSTDHRTIYMRALAWLLQNDYLVHLPTFALIVVTRKIKLATVNIDERDDEGSAIETGEVRVPDARTFNRRHSSYRMEIDEIQDSIIADPRRASPREKRWLAQIAVSGATHNGDLASLLQQLMKYFNGIDCLEQIMIHENVSRVDMRRLLQEFGQYIVTFRHW